MNQDRIQGKRRAVGSIHMHLLKLPYLLAFLALMLFAALWPLVSPLSNPRVAINQHNAVLNIREINLAERGFATKHADAGFACNLPELGGKDFGSQHALDQVLASGTKSGYRFEIQCIHDPTKKVSAYTVTAVPTTPGLMGKYAFCTDQSGEIWYDENGSASDCLKTHRHIDLNRWSL